MTLNMLKSKIHRATVTGADLHYEGSISICPDLIKAAGLRLFEVVEIYNVNNGERFSTYVIKGKTGEICLNGAAARLVHRGDLVIIANYAQYTEAEAEAHHPKAIFVDKHNRIAEIKGCNTEYATEGNA
ncbi:MAG: aspartate 1-decarboxylase [Bdellovibrionaceae bacterium]|nr:aspartate 1-decarboxylase [Pseudobdellovibrionaceae bacterium]